MDENKRDENKSLMVFPCDFIIKVIAENRQDLYDEVIAVTHKYFPGTPKANFQIKTSKQDRYISMSIKVCALDQATLDALYLNLTKLPAVKMVL